LQKGVLQFHSTYTRAAPDGWPRCRWENNIKIYPKGREYGQILFWLVWVPVEVYFKSGKLFFAP
jgi:hypothetical protein